MSCQWQEIELLMSVILLHLSPYDHQLPDNGLYQVQLAPGSLQNFHGSSASFHDSWEYLLSSVPER